MLLRDFNLDFLRWQEEHGVSRREAQTIRGPKGHKRAPMPRAFLRLFEIEGWKEGDHSHPDEIGLRG